jgi:tetratricopeptide (TPR) repeat protein
VVFSLVIAGLSSVDWSGVLGGSEPTPDYAVDSIAVQQTAVAQNPDDLASQGLLASMLANSGRMQEAIPIYERVLEQDPNNIEVRLSFAQSLQSNGMIHDAEAQFLKVIELDQDNHTAHYFLARLYMDWQPRREEDAILHFERVVEIAPNSFYAEQSQSVLDTVGQSTPIASPAAP